MREKGREASLINTCKGKEGGGLNEEGNWTVMHVQQKPQLILHGVLELRWLLRFILFWVKWAGHLYLWFDQLLGGLSTERGCKFAKGCFPSRVGHQDFAGFQWFRICWPMQGTWVLSSDSESGGQCWGHGFYPVVQNLATNAGDMGSIPTLRRSHTCLGKTKPVCHNFWVHALQLLKPLSPRTCALQEKPL